MKRTKIVTHYGKAHRDEFLACCVIIFSEYRQGRICYIERRIATQSDILAPDIWVIDTGGVYEPANLNFDHHHLHGDMCALDMVLKHILGDHKYQNYRAVSPWLKNTSVQDTSGAKVAAEKLHIDLNTYMSTRSPIEKFVLERFAETMVIHCDSYLSFLMRDIGRMIVASAEHLNEDLPRMISNTPVPVDHFGIRLWDIRGLNADDSTSLAVINQAAFQRGVDLMISSTGRSSGGIGLYRQAWAKQKIDLTLLKDHPHAKFTHKNGYYAVLTPEIDDKDILALIAMASSKSNNETTST